MSKQDAIQEFRSRVAKLLNGCWGWYGATSGGGYGVFYYNGESWYAHKFAYFQLRGRVYNHGLKLRRICSTKFCINPQHYKGRLNSDDKGRTLSLDKNKDLFYTYSRVKKGLAELSEETGVDLTQFSVVKAIADKYKVTRQRVYQLIDNEQLYKKRFEDKG